MYARRPRAVFAALALAALALSSAPLASPAATPSTAAAVTKAAVTKAVVTKAGPAKAAVTKALAAKKASGAKKALAAKPQPTAKPLFSYKDAPADEYFGRLKMSILGVRSKVKDLGLDADTHPEHDTAILSTALWLEDAMRDWSKHYPYDRWLPRYAYALENMYERIPGDEAKKRARRQLNYITAYFPQTVYGKVGRAKLVDGIPTPDPSATPATELERLALIDGKLRPTIPPLAAGTPAPDATASANPLPVPAPNVTAAPASSAPPSAAPVNSTPTKTTPTSAPSATLVPTTAAPATAAPATSAPSAAPTPAPSAAPTPAPSAAPTPAPAATARPVSR